jgi:hypothetical protein
MRSNTSIHTLIAEAAERVDAWCDVETMRARRKLAAILLVGLLGSCGASVSGSDGEDRGQGGDDYSVLFWRRDVARGLLDEPSEAMRRAG